MAETKNPFKKSNCFVFSNIDLPASGEVIEHPDAVWMRQAARRQRTLVLANKLGLTINEGNNPVICKVGWFSKGNHAFIYLNTPDDRPTYTVNGLFLWDKGSYEVISKVEGKNFIIFERESILPGIDKTGCADYMGCKFGLYKKGVVLRVFNENEQSSMCITLTEHGWEASPSTD